MSFWVLLQVVVDLILIAAVIGAWFKLQRPAKDDPRLSRGLQLLQSKISVLEDLSDRTETQAHQLTALMEQKCKEIQTQMLQADRQIQQIDVSMNRSLEVAKIFQDKIPHQEIIERQNTIKYVKAARMAHQGATIEEICQTVDLSRGEIEFIAKVNRDQLQFSEADLPEWIQDGHSEAPAPVQAELSSPAVHPREVAGAALSQLGEQFRKALGPQDSGFLNPEEPKPVPVSMAAVTAPPVALQPAAPAMTSLTRSSPRQQDGVVRKVVFPKIDISKNLG
jgi:hypothetical protein